MLVFQGRDACIVGGVLFIRNAFWREIFSLRGKFSLNSGRENYSRAIIRANWTMMQVELF